MPAGKGGRQDDETVEDRPQMRIGTADDVVRRALEPGLARAHHEALVANHGVDGTVLQEADAPTLVAVAGRY